MKKRILVAAAAVALAAVATGAQAGSGKKSSSSWSQRIDRVKRFTVLEAFGGEAVLDGETGLVWEQAPSADPVTWASAQFRCNSLGTGGRRGWRLPALQELASLVDTTNLDAAFIDLPPGHPFDSVQAGVYWTATASAAAAGSAWYVDFSDDGEVGSDSKLESYRVWCVRTGAGLDSQ